jgi:hypothetical protein
MDNGFSADSLPDPRRRAPCAARPLKPGTGRLIKPGAAFLAALIIN